MAEITPPLGGLNYHLGRAKYMNIAVVDVAAENGGATSILEYFYEIHRKDLDNHYFYFLSTYHMEEAANITVINIPEVKKSWLSRLKFDYLQAVKYMQKYKIDEIVSLQNIIVPRFKGRQTVYEHNALPFAEHRFSFREDRLMWVYQNIIGRMMIHSIKKANHVIVQTEWMKREIQKKVPNTGDKIEICFPEVSIPSDMNYEPNTETIFFYPANEMVFKNHEVILQACKLLQDQGIENYSVVFTLLGDENEKIKKLYIQTKEEHLNVKWIGRISRNKVFEYYQKSILVFPSYLETVGLPIYEAMKLGCPVLLADLAYARGVARDYKDAHFFDYQDKNELMELMRSYI